MWLGKIIGALLGFSAFGFFGAIFGALIGNMFDRGLSRFAMDMTGGRAHLGQVQEVFFHTVFSLMGSLAKADGRISEEEVAHTQAFMSELGLTMEHRRRAIGLFKAGAEPDFDIDTALQEFQQACGSVANLRQLLLVYLVGVALADGVLDQAEEDMLRRVAQNLGYSAQAFDDLIRMIQAQNRFGGGQAVRESDIAMAYQALGVTESDSDAVVKKAYRRLMSEFHPDKLIGQGVPDDMIKVATERSQEIQKAYDQIKNHRKG